MIPLTPRDYIALPFLFLGLACEYLAVSIGGNWTAKLIAEREKQHE